jgi:hypothetical protein
LNPTPVTNPSVPGYQFFNWKLNVSGNYKGLLSFLEEVPKGNRMAVVSDLQSSASFDEEKNDYQLNVSMNLALVVMAPKSASPTTTPNPSSATNVPQEKVKQ